MLINDPNQEPCRLAPLEAFSNELAPKDLRRRRQPEREPNQVEGRSENGQSRVRVPTTRSRWCER